jgi:MFS family permease
MMQSSAGPLPAGWRTPLLIIVAGCLISTVGFGLRSVFGLFLEPMTVANGWSRETFALALAIQNLLWGAGVPVAGALADRFGPARVIAGGAIVYGIGVFGMAEAASPLALHVSAGIVTGLGVAFTAFSLAMAAMARVVGPERRSLALGLGTAAGSFGQVLFSPLAQAWIQSFGWHDALLILALTAGVIIPLAFVLPSGTAARGEPVSDQRMGDALREALGHSGYMLLTVGFFVCGFHVAFITVHFPAYIGDLGLSPEVGAYAIALIGLFNIAGSFLSGMFGQRWSKKAGLSAIYFLRALAILALLAAPKTALTIYLFAGTMGILWLSTVPLTTGIVAQVFGLRYMATLFGIVFFSHQLGSFLGVWLGGFLYDRIGSYDPVWWAGVALGLAAALIHLPIDQRPLARLAPAGS